MIDIALYEPEIPPNTGNIIRLCANTGARLHLIEPLGFALEDSKLRPAGLDYHEWARVETHSSLTALYEKYRFERTFGVSTRGRSYYHQVTYRPGDLLLFGPETRGLPEEVLQTLAPEHRLRIPMQAGVRSLNLSNAVAVVVYEAWRQQGFAGAS